MEERRRSLRTELSGELVIERLDLPEGEKAEIHVIDVSKGGIGFSCDKELEMGSFYQCLLTIWTKEVLHTCIQIIRAKELPEGYEYGGQFIAINEKDCQRIETYQIVEAYKH